MASKKYDGEYGKEGGLKYGQNPHLLCLEKKITLGLLYFKIDIVFISAS